jgi:carbon storage regulator
MLVLSRHENEAIVIGGQIRVTVVEIRGHQIRLGIEAPKEVAVWREELVASATKRELAVA